MSQVLVIVPGRIGSKGVPNKNFRPLAGPSPLVRAVECAVDAGLTEIVISSDCQTLNGVLTDKVYAKALYAPAPLHTDTCSMVDVVLDVLKRVPGPADQKVLLLQPTQPLRTPEHLRRAIALLDANSSVASVVEVEPAQKLYFEGFRSVCGEGTGLEQRQNALATYASDGTVYGFRRTWFCANRIFRCSMTRMLLIPPSETARLDTPFDWEMAELRIARASAHSTPSSR